MKHITDQSTLAFQRMMDERTRNKPFDPVVKDIAGQPVDPEYIQRVTKALDQACAAEHAVHIDELEDHARGNA